MYEKDRCVESRKRETEKDTHRKRPRQFTDTKRHREKERREKGK